MRKALRRPLLGVLSILDRTLVAQFARKENVIAAMLVLGPILAIIVGFAAEWVPFLFSVAVILMLGFPCVPLIALMFQYLIERVHRERPFGGKLISATQYWKISDVLEARGINRVKKCIQEHPQHRKEMLELEKDLYKAPVDDLEMVIALVFRNDTPEATRGKIKSIIYERGIMTASEVRGLLDEVTKTHPALTEGAL